MKVTIKRIDKTLPLPKYETAGSVAVDLVSRTDQKIQPGKVAVVPTNIVIKTPPGYMFVVVPRSSTPRKKGLLIPHGIGIIDQDFAGPHDEVGLQVLNFSDKTVHIERGERLGQGVFVKIAKVTWREIENVKTKTRGGFGSTG